MINVQGDLSGVGNYIGTIEGILQAVEDPRFEGDFVEHMMDSVSSNFMVETVAAHEAGRKSIQHVFEWGDMQGEMSNIPLFTLTRSGIAGTRQLGYMFLPSTQYVPLPDPSRYGFDPEKLQYLRRHTFQLKALVMETQSNAVIAPKGDKRLFVPSKKAQRGYFMTSKPQEINPGGPQSTGGFAMWWNEWFMSRGQAVVSEEVEKTQGWLVATGAKYVRYVAGTSINGMKVGGRFASGKAVSAGYINSKAESVKSKVMKESKALFDNDAYEGQWE